MKKIDYPIIIVAMMMAFTLFSVTGLSGFMVAHAGTAGPHLFSSGMNALGAPWLLHSEMLYADGTIEPYNHHPPLFFWLQTVFAWFFEGHRARLEAAYVFSGLVSAGTLVAVFVLLKRMGIGAMAASLAVAAICGTRMYATYRGFITFDVVSPLLSMLFVYAIWRLETVVNRMNLLIFAGVGVLALMTSYYGVTVIAGYLGWKIVFGFRRLGLMGTVKSWPFLMAGALGAFFVGEIMLLMLQEKMAHGVVQSFQASVGRQESLNGGGLQESALYIVYVLVRRCAETLPLFPLFVAIGCLAWRRGLKKQRFEKNAWAVGEREREVLQAAGFVALGAAIFILLTPVWSKVHPFAFLWFAGPIAVVVGLGMDRMKDSAWKTAMIWVLVAGGPLWILSGYGRDLEFSRASGNLLDVVDEVYPAGTTYHFTGVVPDCVPYTAGQVIYMGSYPNRFLAKPGTVVSSTLPYVEVSCVGDGIMGFVPKNMPEGVHGVVIKFGGR